MKPKDLLVHLEKGDRTVEHLTEKKPAQAETDQTMSALFQQAYGGAFGQLFGGGSPWGTSTLGGGIQQTQTLQNTVQFQNHQFSIGPNGELVTTRIG